MSQSLNAHVVLHKLALALPKKHHSNIIIVGSLSAAAQLIQDADTELRTKDIDGMLTPNATAVISAKEIATTLINEGWEPRVNTEKYDHPADGTTPQDKLPVVRLKPPCQGKDEWFLELLGAPPELAPDAEGKTRYSERVETPHSHFEIPSFAYLGVTQFKPVRHASGLQLASVATMALSNLLHHPQIEEKRMSDPMDGRLIKRANKDLGRVVAMAHLCDQLDETAVEQWPHIWQQAVQELRAPESTRAKLDTINTGMQALLDSYEDQLEALHSVNFGLLSSQPMDMRQFNIAIRRYLQLTKVR
jgi:hypothetical protein